MIFLVVVGFLLVEAWRARGNERRLFARSGTEPAGDVYAIMRVAYPSAFLAMFAEGFLRHSAAPPLLLPGVMLFILAKALKWWAILSLGPYWTFRVVVVPGASLVTTGPYRVLRHPNYVAVIGELVAVALMNDARIAGPIMTFAFATLIAMRVRVENRALGDILKS